MARKEDPFGLRACNLRRLRQNEDDAEARKLRLKPSRVTAWTTLIAQVAKNVVARGKPCDYEPWKNALADYSRKPSKLDELSANDNCVSADLVNFAADVAQPGWPEPRPDLIEYALTFLEADVMLFRSGYVKRHLIRRLQQSELDCLQVSRVDMLLRRAVIHGTGLEECRAFRKLAAHLCTLGHLAELPRWLERKAEGAILTLDRADGALWKKMIESPGLSERDKKLLASVSFFRPSKWGIVYPEMNKVVRARKAVKEPSEKVKYSAFLMLTAIDRREISDEIRRAC